MRMDGLHRRAVRCAQSASHLDVALTGTRWPARREKCSRRLQSVYTKPIDSSGAARVDPRGCFDAQRRSRRNY